MSGHLYKVTAHPFNPPIPNDKSSNMACNRYNVTLFYLITIFSLFFSRGITTWMCTDIDGGDSFREEILANVRDAKVFLIFVNEKWAKSQECAFEFNYAMVRHLVNIT